MKGERERPGIPAKKVLADRNFRIILGVTLMSVLGVASVTPAFPEIAAEMGLTAAHTALLVSVFTIPGLVFTPLLGLLADRWGRKKVLVPCLLLFGLAGGGCALAPSFGLLLFLRFLQGTGASALNSLNVTLIGDLFSGSERSEAMGYNTSVIGVGTAGYPALGGLLATLGWRYPFALAFAGVFTGLWALRGLEESKPPDSRPRKAFDFSGLRTVVLRRSTLLLLATSAMTFIILYGAFLTYLPFYMSGLFGASPLEVGLVSAAMAMASAVTASRYRFVSEKLSERSRLALAFMLFAGGLALTLAVPACCGMILPAAFFGVGQGINMPTLLSMLTEIAPDENRAVFLSLNSMSLRLGQTLGPLLMGFVFSFLGIGAVFLSGALLALLTAAVLFGMLEKPETAS